LTRSAGPLSEMLSAARPGMRLYISVTITGDDSGHVY